MKHFEWLKSWMRRRAKKKGVAIDPDSGLPIGSVIRNHKGEYGVVDYKGVHRITEKQRDELLRELEK